MFARVIQRLKEFCPTPHWKYQYMFRQLTELQAECEQLRTAVHQCEKSLVDGRLTVNLKLGRHLACMSNQATNERETLPQHALTPRADAPDFEACLRKLEALCPNAFGMWRQLLDVNAHEYETLPIDSCSVQGHPRADDFRRFLRLYLRGNVLDIGCGPQPVPHYLVDHPLTQIAGIDPLEPLQRHPFTFWRGVSEFLPWKDRTFDLVVASTSLDHVFLLDKTFEEIRRVLKPSGRFVTWVGFVPGSPIYDPFHPGLRPVDAFHLFHLDRPWFFDAVKPFFEEEERLDVEGSTFLSFVVRR